MRAEVNKQGSQISRQAAWYNQGINLFWSVLSFGPIGYFCYVYLPDLWLYSSLALGLITILLPTSFYRAIQLSPTAALYHNLGIRTVRKYTQDGSVVNGLIKRRFAAYNLLRSKSISSLLTKAAINERFHGGACVFFFLTSVYAFTQGRWWWLVWLTISNLMFNGYPVLLQQYNRIRLKQALNRQLRQG